MFSIIRSKSGEKKEVALPGTGQKTDKIKVLKNFV